MKRTVSLVIALLFLVLSLLTGCQSAEKTSETTSPAEVAQPISAKIEPTSDSAGAVRLAQTSARVEAVQTASKASARIPVSAGDDGTIDVLLIGNSFCTGWQDELNEMLRAAGLNVTFYVAFHAGSTLSQHWEWLQDDAAEYSLRFFRGTNLRKKNNVTLKYCLELKEWDVISIQEAFYSLAEQDYNGAEVIRNTTDLAAKLYDYIRSCCPQATLVWNQTWAQEVGFVNGIYSVPTQAAQDRMHSMLLKIGNIVTAQNGAYLIPTGLAFQLARQKGSGDLSRGDGCHDGQETGGQFLNACVWYECITGKGCKNNPWRPTGYRLPEERVVLLMKAAHQAVKKIYK